MKRNLLDYLFYKCNLRKLFSERNIKLGNIRIGSSAYVKGCVLNGTVCIGKGCKIYKTEIFGNVFIGDYTSIWGPNSDLYASINDIRIGKFCSIARNVSFQEYNHNYKEFTTYNLVKNVLKNDSPKADLVSKGAIVVENDVWIGTQCVILGGAYISTGAVVSANSVVNSFVPPYAIVAGSPARIVKYRFDKNTIDALLETKWWDWDKVDIIKNVETLRNIVK